MRKKIEISLVRTKVYDLLKEEILSGEIKLGQRLNVRKLSKELGISPTPVRDALLALAADGLVKVVPRVGFFVTELSENYIYEVTESRMMVETFCLEKYFDEIKNSPNILKIYDEAKEVANTKDRKLFDDSDQNLHMLIVRSSSNRTIIDFYEKLWDRIDLVRHLNKRYLNSNKEHMLIIESILRNEKENAIKFLLNHMENVKKETLKNLESSKVTR
ncbi:MAG: GntR family transcriptional regulator [Thermotogae bacterium]|nr:GntR family transcriptional regulator [Thermotogota bacterium]